MTKPKPEIDKQEDTEYRVYIAGGDHVDIAADELDHNGGTLIFRSGGVDIAHFYLENLAGWIKLSEARF